MKKKQLLALGMATVMALGVFAGCGDSKNASGGNASEKAEGGEEEKVSGEIRYAFWDSAQEAYFKKCVEEFNKIYPGIEHWQTVPMIDVYGEKLTVIPAERGSGKSYTLSDCRLDISLVKQNKTYDLLLDGFVFLVSL